MKESSRKIAIIGSGVSGLICSYLLQQKHKVVLFEANSYLGGHTHTVDVEINGESLAIDTGFIVFNNKTYPNFIKFLQQLGVPWKDTEMSFSVSAQDIGLEYNGNNLNTLFAQRRNLLNPFFYKMLYEIVRFNNLCKKLEENSEIPLGQSLNEFLSLHRFSNQLKKYYLFPMVAAIWSSSLKEAGDFSIEFFIRFFSNHGLLNINDRPQWHVVNGGSREYIRKLLPKLKAEIRLKTPVQQVERLNNQVQVKTSESEKEEFDEVIFACHSDQALKLIKDPTENEKHVLSKLQYQNNQVTLHTDTSLLPKNKKAWASWNYLIEKGSQFENQQANVSYNMNILQSLNSNTTFVVSLNQDKNIQSEKVLRQFTYAHPVFNQNSEAAKAQRDLICGLSQTHFCGAYWHNGFHEDGVRSAIEVCQRFGVSL